MENAFAFVAGAAVVFTLVAFFVAGARDAISVAVGSGLVLFDAWALGRIWRAILSDDPAVMRWRGLWIALALAKLVVLFGGLWLLLSHGVVTAMGAAAGIAALPAGLVVFAIAASTRASVHTPFLRGRDRGIPSRKHDS